MKTNTKHIVMAIMLFTTLFFLYGTTHAQSTKKMTIKVDLLKDGEVSKTNNFIVKIIDEQYVQYEIKPKTGFTADLEYNHQYKVIFYHEGTQPKYVYINTKAPVEKKVKYVFMVNLKSSEISDLINAGGIYYDSNKEIFDYYLN